MAQQHSFKKGDEVTIFNTKSNGHLFVEGKAKVIRRMTPQSRKQTRENLARLRDLLAAYDALKNHQKENGK